MFKIQEDCFSVNKNFIVYTKIPLSNSIDNQWILKLIVAIDHHAENNVTFIGSHFQRTMRIWRKHFLENKR